MPIHRIALLLILAGVPSAACAQNLTVQQPSVSNFSVSTTVVAPDRGGAYLGGVSRGAMGRSSYGPFRSSVGTESSAGAMSTHVWIHDMAELDRQVLNAATAVPDARARLSPQAEHAFQVMQRRQGQPVSTVARGAGPQPFTAETTAASAAFEQGRASLEKGRAAMAKGKIDLAKVYFRMADKAGVPEARGELALANQKLAKTVTR